MRHVIITMLALASLAGCATARLHHMSNSELQLRRYQLATRLSYSSDENWSDDLDEKESIEREMLRRGLRFQPVPEMASSHPLRIGIDPAIRQRAAEQMIQVLQHAGPTYYPPPLTLPSPQPQPIYIVPNPYAPVNAGFR